MSSMSTDFFAEFKSETRPSRLVLGEVIDCTLSALDCNGSVESCGSGSTVFMRGAQVIGVSQGVILAARDDHPRSPPGSAFVTSPIFESLSVWNMLRNCPAMVGS